MNRQRHSLISPAERSPLPSLHESILRTLLYFDIFGHPLTAEEIYRFLPANSTTPRAVINACRSEKLTGIVHSDCFYQSIGGNDDHHRRVQERHEKEDRAKKYWRIARFMARIIKHFPFVRGICVSGELSKGVMTKGGDIDFVIMTEMDRLWIARTLLIAFKKVVLLNRRKFFCPNLFLSRRLPQSESRTLYDAMEIITLVPLTNYDLYLRYLEQNSWVRDFFPNARPDPGTRTVNHESLLQRVAEFPLRGRAGDWLDRKLMHWWKDIWRRRYSALSEEKQNSLFVCLPDISTSYVGDFLPAIMEQFRQRVEAFFPTVPSKGVHG